MRTELALMLTYDNPILTIEDVASLMGITSRVLERKINEGTCPVPMFKFGSKWKCHVTDVAKFIDDQRATATKLLQTMLQAS